MRSLTFDQWIRIREAQKHADKDPDPQHMPVPLPFILFTKYAPTPSDDNGILSVTSVEAVFEKTISVEEQEQQEKKDEDTWSKLGDTISQFFAKTDEKEGGAAPEEVPAEGEEGKSSADPKANSSKDETKAKKEEKKSEKEEKKSEKKKEPKKPKVEVVKEELAVEEERYPIYFILKVPTVALDFYCPFSPGFSLEPIYFLVEL
jgi:hypothetical protein